MFKRHLASLRHAAEAKRRAAAKKGKGDRRQTYITEDNWEGLLEQHGRSRAGFKVQADSPDAATSDAPAEREFDAIVMSVATGRCRVFRGGEEIDCVVPSEIGVLQKSVLTVGDRVAVSGEGESWRIDAIAPRRSILARPDPLHRHRQRLIAANIDVVIHVVSVKAPPLRPRLIDRFMIAIQRGEAQPALCVNKIDLIDDAEREEVLAQLQPYRELDVPVVACSVKSGEGIDELRDLVRGRTAALVGHSGVGKSSILNAIDRSLGLAVGDLNRKRGTGRHTTTASTLYDFGEETYLIDTPGIREFGLWDLDRDTLRDYFPEFAEPSEECRFTDCTHVHEPHCEVKDAVARGELNSARYDTYARLYNDLA